MSEITFKVKKDFLKNLMAAVIPVSNEVCINFTCDGFSIMQSDIVRGMMVSLFVSKDAVDNYFCDENRTIGMELNAVQKAVKSCSEDVLIVIPTDGPKEGLVTFISGKFKWTTDTISTDGFNNVIFKKEPPIEPPYAVEIATKDLTQFMSNKALFKDVQSVRFNANPDGLELTMAENERKQCSQVLATSFNDVDTDKVISTFSREYAEILASVLTASINGSSKLYLGIDYPLKAEINISDSVTIKYYIAPWVSSD